MKTSSLVKATLAALALASPVIALGAIVAAPAYADIAASKAVVDAAKSKGIVGEQNDGFLGFVTASSDAGLKAAVAEINAGRQDVFNQAAAKNGVSAEAAGISAYTKLVEKMPAGQYYQDNAGNWVKK